jgi:2-(1,2-epoxy-1,2-dihydrophenyl)acetyl-CoA isomerase
MSVDLSISGSIATLLLNRPDKLNALSSDMWRQLSEHLDRCQQDDDIRAVVMTGAGRGFCAGADISRPSGGPIDDRPISLASALDAMTGYNTVIRKLYHLRKPTIAAVRGPAIGIAWTMVLCCDFVLVTESAKFRPAFLNLAKVPEGGIVYLISRLVGQFKARDIIYRARFVSGREAVELGLATQLVSEDSLMDDALVLARELAAGPPLAFALTKRLFNSDAPNFDQFSEQELNAIAIAANTSDAIEGMAAFKEKRPAQYTGR